MVVNAIEQLQWRCRYIRWCVTLVSTTSEHMGVFGGEIYAQQPCALRAHQFREMWAPFSQIALEGVFGAYYCPPLPT